jgi:hypothetical protein
MYYLYRLFSDRNFLLISIINQITMANKTTKAPAKTAAKKASTPAKAKTSPSDKIEKASLQALKTLEALGIEQQLQQDIEWCLGSYRHDKNPAGLLEMTERALSVLIAAKERKAKGVTSKLIGDIEKALQDK